MLGSSSKNADINQNDQQGTQNDSPSSDGSSALISPKRKWEISALGISLFAHAIILLVLAFFTFAPPEKVFETIVFSDINEQREPETYNLDIEISEQFDETTDIDSTSAAVTMTAETTEAVEEKVEENIKEELEEPEITLTESVPQPSMTDLVGKVSVTGNTEYLGSVRGAMDRLTFEIASSVSERPTLVVWMFDASGSLDKRRTAIKERFTTVYKQLGLTKKGDAHALKTVVASFGKDLKVMTPKPTSDPATLIKAIQAIKADRSGEEYVFQSVRTLAKKYLPWRTKQDHNVMLVIVTDERGDDLEGHLEPTIAMMRRNGIKAYCVGNAAIFGRKTGYVEMTWKEGVNTFTEEIPVDQGPETLYPQRLELGFWGVSNHKMERMTANYGPYGLTRLCSETGGLYLISQEPNGQKFDTDIMANYKPDYRPVRLLKGEVKRNRAKASLLDAAIESQRQEIAQPTLKFRADTDGTLRQEITEAQKLFVVFDSHLEHLQNILDNGARSRKTIKEPRWRASFDLAMGRVYAMRARAFGYNVVLANMKSSPKAFKSKKNNHWQLVSSKKINGGIRVRKLAEKADLYLKKVVKEHSGTPWATLAQYELRRPLGWDWKENYTYIAPPRPVVTTPNPNAKPRPAPKPKPKPKNRPKL